MGRKSGFLALVLWLPGLFLICGLHRIYVGRFWTGVLWFFTLGLFGIGQLIDLFRLGDMVRMANSEGLSDLRYAAPTNTVAPVFNVSINAVPSIVPAEQRDMAEGRARRLLQKR